MGGMKRRKVNAARLLPRKSSPAQCRAFASMFAAAKPLRCERRSLALCRRAAVAQAAMSEAERRCSSCNSCFTDGAKK